MKIKKSDLEWIIEQLEYLEDQAESIRSEAYNCRKVVGKILSGVR
jgi:prefoldin subunit 5